MKDLIIKKLKLHLFVLAASIISCGGEKDTGLCLVNFSFERAESQAATTSGNRAGGNVKLIYRGNLDDQCVEFIEKKSGGFSYVIRGKSEYINTGVFTTASQTLSTVDFGGGRIDKFTTATTGINSQAGSSFVNGTLELTVSHLDDSPTATTGQNTTGTTNNSSSVSASSKSMELPWTDGVRTFEVTFLSTQQNVNDTSGRPSAVTILFNLPDKN